MYMSYVAYGLFFFTVLLNKKKRKLCQKCAFFLNVSSDCCNCEWFLFLSGLVKTTLLTFCYFSITLPLKSKDAQVILISGIVPCPSVTLNEFFGERTKISRLV